MQEKKGTTEDEMVGWHHRLNGHERGQTLGSGEGQGGLVCCSPWGHRESDMTWRLNNNNRFLQVTASLVPLKDDGADFIIRKRPRKDSQDSSSGL